MQSLAENTAAWKSAATSASQPQKSSTPPCCSPAKTTKPFKVLPQRGNRLLGAERLREAVEGKVVVTPAAGYNESAELFGSEVEYLYATPAQWIAQIASASLVVTTSFHGIAFSILMHTPFVYVPLKGEFQGANNRILDLLRDLRLEERILSERTTYGSIIARPIDWASVDTLLARMRQDSLEFLKEALK